MSVSKGMANRYLTAFSKNWCWFLGWGVLLVVLGVLALSFSVLTTMLSVILLGCIIFAAGVFVIMDAFSFWWGKGGGFFLHLLIGILYLSVGFIMFKGPVGASISITFLLAVFYIMLGFLRIIYSLSLRMPQWGWGLFNGIVALVLGVLVLSQWPESSLFIIGLFIGIDLIVSGWTYIMAALAARSLK